MPIYEQSLVAEFWAWFKDHAEDIRAAYNCGDSSWLDKRISPRLARIQERLHWEIGPYHHPDDTFALSPTIRENLPLTRMAVAQAPELLRWQFVPAKPPKVLKSLVFMVDDLRLCADDWRYRLTAYNSGQFVDIELLINNDGGFPSQFDTLFTELVVESLIGEECRLVRIGYITPTLVTNNTLEERSTPIFHLKDHLAKVLAPEKEEADITPNA
jgi:hypothetical protein